MKLIEVVIGKRKPRTPPVPARSVFARQIAKLPVIVRDSPGFLVNRVLFPYLLDAAELFENGVNATGNRRGAFGMGNADGAVALDR